MLTKKHVLSQNYNSYIELKNHSFVTLKEQDNNKPKKSEKTENKLNFAIDFTVYKV